jgi:hypothetical protein
VFLSLIWRLCPPGVLQLTFNEPMDLASLDMSGLVLAEFAYTGYGQSYRLTRPSRAWREDVGRVVGLKLSGADWEGINRRPPLTKSKDQVFLIMENRTISDTAGETIPSTSGVALRLRSPVTPAGNPVIGIADGEGVLSYTYEPDHTQPALLNYTLDMDSGRRACSVLMCGPVLKQRARALRLDRRAGAGVLGDDGGVLLRRERAGLRVAGPELFHVPDPGPHAVLVQCHALGELPVLRAEQGQDRLRRAGQRDARPPTVGVRHERHQGAVVLW